MSQFFEVHPDNPQPRLIRHAVDIVRDGGVAVVPTDSNDRPRQPVYIRAISLENVPPRAESRSPTV